MLVYCLQFFFFLFFFVSAGVGNPHGRPDCLTSDAVWAVPDSYRLKPTPALAQFPSDVVRDLVLNLKYLFYI